MPWLDPLSSFTGGVRLDTLTARLQDRNLDAAARSDRTGRILVLQSIKGRADHIIGVRRALRLRNNIVHAERLENGAHRATRDDTGASRRRTQHDAACTVAANHIVMQSAAFTQRYADQ